MCDMLDVFSFLKVCNEEPQLTTLSPSNSSDLIIAGSFDAQ